jgi:hypothetical protein
MPNMPWSYMYPWAAAVAVLLSRLVRVISTLVLVFFQHRASQAASSRVLQLLHGVVNDDS